MEVGERDETAQLAVMITPSMSEIITCIVLTLPVVPRDRWFICCVIGPIMLAGCMDIVWSMVGVITAPWWRTSGRRQWPKKENAYDSFFRRATKI